jgi:hypothetical protein
VIRRTGTRTPANAVEDLLEVVLDGNLAVETLGRLRRGEENGRIFRKAGNELRHIQILET